MPRQLSMTPAAIYQRKRRAKIKTNKMIEANRQHAEKVRIKRARRANKVELTQALKQRREREEKGIIQVVQSRGKKLILYKAKQTKITENGKPLRFHKIEAQPAMMATEIKPLLRKITDKYEGKIRITAYFSTLGIWRSSKPFNGGEPPSVPDLMENTYNSGVDYDVADTLISRLTMFIRPEAEKSGGDSTKNDCLYNCLEEAFQGKPPNKLTASLLKTRLKLKRDDKIHINKIPEIEKQFRFNIHITGDHTYVSPEHYAETVYLQLENGHYTLNTEHRKHLNKLTFNKYSPLAFYKTRENDVLAYNGKKYLTYDIEEFEKYKNRRYESPYNFIKARTINIKQEFHDYDTLSTRLYHATDKQVSITQGSAKDAALRLFFKTTQTINPDPITPAEQLFLDKAFKGGHIYAEKGYYENTTTYDINSMYPSIMNSNFSFPIKQGKFTILTELPEFLSYGIYRVKINNTNPKLFTSNHNDFYTHVDVARARELGFQIELIQSEEANALLYEKNRVMGKRMFGKFVNTLYECKKHNKLAKLVLNTLWGALAQKNKRYEVLDINTEHDVQGEIDDIRVLNENKILLSSIGKRVFKMDYARIAPFLTAKGRSMISKVIEPYADNVVRIHTDGFIFVPNRSHGVGFICGVEITDGISGDMGALKVEHKGSVEVINKNIIKKYIQ